MDLRSRQPATLDAGSVVAELQTTALDYVARGFALTWMNHGAKFPQHEAWNSPVQVITTPEQVRRRWNGTPRNIGVVHGLGTVKTCSLDVDDEKHARAALAEVGIDLNALTVGTPCCVGKNPRFVYVQPAGADLELVKLQWPDPADPKRKVTIFELRAGANQDVLPPSRHPSGKPYEWRHPLPADPADHPTPPPALLELWWNWSAWEPLLQAACPWVESIKPKSAPRSKEAGSHLDIIGRFNQAHDVRQILEANGYEPRGKSRYLPPNSTSGVPSVRILDSGAYSDNGSCALNDGKIHDAFDCFRVLEHGGNWTAAVKAAAKLLGIERTQAQVKQEGPPPGAVPDIDPILAARCGIGPEPTQTPLLDTEVDWPDPYPLPTELPRVELFPLDLLPAALCPWIEDITHRLQCPPEYPAVGAMVSLASLVGRKVGIRPKRHDDWTVVPNLWGLIVGRPGVLKTPALHEVMKPIMRLEVNAKNRHDLDKADADANKAVADARRKVNEAKIRDAIKKGSDPYEIARMGLRDADAAPTRRRYLVNDSSVEKLGELLNENPNGLLVFRDELLGMLYSLEREGQECARQFYLEAWNGTSRFTYDRIVRGTVDIEACCLSLLGSIQPGPLQDYLTTAPDDGLMQRFQLAVWPDMNPDWKDIDHYPDKAAKEQAWEVFLRLDAMVGVAVGAIPADDGGIPCLRFDADAQAEFSAWRVKLETRLRTEELHPALETCLAKHRSLIPSLALLIHLADAPEGGPVPLSALLKACAWGEYLESHAKRIYAAHTHSVLLGAVRLAEKIKAGTLKTRFTLRDAYRPQWSRLATPEQVQAAVNILVDHDWLRAEPEQTGGRPRTWYAINPKVKQGQL